MRKPPAAASLSAAWAASGRKVPAAPVRATSFFMARNPIEVLRTPFWFAWAVRTLTVHARVLICADNDHASAGGNTPCLAPHQAYQLLSRRSCGVFLC